MNNNGTHHEGKKTFKLANDIPSGKLFGVMSDDSVYLAGKGDNHRPLCVINDCGSINDPVMVHILGSNASTMQATAGSHIQIGDFITSNNNSQAVNVATLGTGSYHIAGIAVSNAFPGEFVEFSPTLGLEKSINA